MSAPKRNSYIVSRLKEEWEAKEQQASRPFLLLSEPSFVVSGFTGKFFEMRFHRFQRNISSTERQFFRDGDNHRGDPVSRFPDSESIGIYLCKSFKSVYIHHLFENVQREVGHKINKCRFVELAFNQ